MPSAAQQAPWAVPYALKPPAEVTDLIVDTGPTGNVKVRMVRPPGHPGPLPVMLYTHGAGWVLGSPQTHDLLVRNLAVGAGAAVVFERPPRGRLARIIHRVRITRV